MNRWICLLAVLVAATANAASAVAFDWFEYSGHEVAFQAPLLPGKFHNPILAGYYPDPAITRVGDRFYLVNSSFAHWPGIPVHESEDLVHWKLIGYALQDTSKVSFDNLGISRGVFAPSISFHDGNFYVIDTLVDAGGNFFVTASNPAGPWSDPHWLPQVDGIDPSFFFDADGKAYVLNNGPPDGPPLYNGHRAIWIQQFDVAQQKLIGPRKLIVNGGTDLAKKPVWIEGPHMYRINGRYYLMCAEGGTASNHSEVIFRADSPWGPFEPYSDNPILTQRDLPPARALPVTNAGHADLVQLANGDWWAVFLASRPYDAAFHFNTGRETFLLPVSWKNGWPVILPHGVAIPYTLDIPRTGARGQAKAGDALSGNFTRRDDFDTAQPGPEWLQIRVPKKKWFELRDGELLIHPLAVNLDAQRNPSFYARRQAHRHFEASTQLVPPREGHVAAGLAVYQNGRYWYFMGVRRKGGSLELFLERHAGEHFAVLKSIRIDEPNPLKLRVQGDGAHYAFRYDTGRGWQSLVEDADGLMLSTEVAGGFVGTVLGPFARQE